MELQEVHTDHNLLHMECLDAWIARQLTTLLREAGLESAELAERVGMPVALLRERLELRSSFLLVELVRIAMVLGLEPAALVPPTDLPR
ncbi:hypothetical protein [Nocardia jiangsuensis]|uniref:XRE family transcriptional regulator n=1 Tax=Nocardia jiangsuensis TaxID=1691563 RepID=A0ABV8DU43_9NOCA